ncbi:chlorite dismutase family protein, partial [Micrococcus luteus]
MMVFEVPGLLAGHFLLCVPIHAPKERARMLREHGQLGQDFPQVWANTTS